MTRFRILLLVPFVAAACHSESPPPPQAAPNQPPQTKRGKNDLHQLSFAQRLRLRKHPDGGVNLDAGLDRFAEFSVDNRVFAYSLDGQLHFVDVPTGVEGKTLPLDTPAHREEALEALENENVPPRGDFSPAPKQLTATIQKGTVVLTLPGAPAIKPYAPFAGSAATVDSAEVVGEAHNGKFAAVRINGTRPGGKGLVTEYHLFPLAG